jgi:hypothetical protein
VLGDGHERQENEAMVKKILVPLGRYDRSEHIIPYIQKVARPGMKVIFLVSYPVGGMKSQREAYGMKAALESARFARGYAWEASVAAAMAQIAAASEALRARDVEVSVELYTGSLQNKIRSYTAAGDVDLILTHGGILQRILAVLKGHSSFLELLTGRPDMPVLLIQPGA